MYHALIHVDAETGAQMMSTAEEKKREEEKKKRKEKEKKRAEEEKKRAEEDRLAVENHKQIIAKTTPAARTRISAAAPAATAAKAAEARKESRRSAKSADGLKLTQTRGKGFLAKEKEPATHVVLGDTPEAATIFDHGRSSNRPGRERRHHESDDARSVRRCPLAGPNNNGVGRDATTRYPAGTGGEAAGICSHDRPDNHLAFLKGGNGGQAQERGI
jgi:hypothetical protein